MQRKLKNFGIIFCGKKKTRKKEKKKKKKQTNTKTNKQAKE